MLWFFYAIPSTERNRFSTKEFIAFDNEKLTFEIPEEEIRDNPLLADQN